MIRTAVLTAAGSSNSRVHDVGDASRVLLPISAGSMFAPIAHRLVGTRVSTRNAIAVRSKVARYHDHVRLQTPSKSASPRTGRAGEVTRTDGHARIPLSSPKVIGVVNDRGNRRCVSSPHACLDLADSVSSHQEDFYSYAALSLPTEELKLSLKKSFNIDWDPTLVPESLAREVLFVGVYDGYGACFSFSQPDLKQTMI